jgi:hypothetical protein
MSGIARTGRPLSATLFANGWAEARLVPVQPAPFGAIANRLITDRSVPSQAIPLRWIAGPLIAEPLIATLLIASVPNRFPSNPLQAIQLMAGPFTPNRPPAAGPRPALASAVRLGRGQHRAAGRLADPFSGVQP